eukprot:569671_1
METQMQEQSDHHVTAVDSPEDDDETDELEMAVMQEIAKLKQHDDEPLTQASDRKFSVEVLAKQITQLVDQEYTERFKKDYDPSNKPLKCPKCDFKRVIDWGVPLLVLLLVIIAAGSRTERDIVSSKSEICETVIVTTNANTTDSYKQCYTYENDGLTSFNPVSTGWKIMLSMIPFVCVFQGVLAYNLSSRYVAPFSLVVTVILGLLFFEDEGWWIEPSGKQSNIITTAGLVFITIVDRTIWTIFEYAFNVFTSFFFLRVLELWGVIDVMRKEFESMCNSDNRKVTLILFCFAIMIAVVAPGGSNFLIAGAIMVDINHRSHEDGEVRDDYDKRIGAICLFGNGLTSAFNLVGVCVIAISSDIIDLAHESGDEQCATGEHSAEWEEKCAAKQIGGYFSLMFFFFSVITPFIMAAMYNRKPTYKDVLLDLKNDFVVLFLCGSIYALVQFLCSWLIGPELVCLLSAGCSLIGYYAYVQCKNYGIKMNGTPNFKKRKFVWPFIILVTLLCCIRLIPGFQEVLEGGENEVAAAIFNPYVLNIKYLRYKFERHFGWLAHSGMTVLVVSILTVFIVPYTNKDDELEETLMHSDPTEHNYKKGKTMKRLKRGLHKDATRLKVIEELYEDDINTKRKYVLVQAFKKSIGEALPVMLSIGCYASIAKVMAAFHMTQTVANGIVAALEDAPQVYVAFMPIIGMMGSGLTGSTTTSNFLFGRLQVTTALELGLIDAKNGMNTIWEVAGAQILGATGGEIVSPMNAVFSTLLLASRFPESELIKMVLKLFGFWMIGCVVMCYIFMNTKINLSVV